MILIACDKYKSESYGSLEHAVSDAESLRSALSCHGVRTYRRLYNEQVTRSNIMKCFDDFANEYSRSPIDITRLICYIGCHGYKHSSRSPNGKIVDTPYFVMHDTEKEYPRATSLLMQDLREIAGMLPAVHQLYVIDSCFAADSLYRHRGGYQGSLLSKQCCVAMCSSTTNQRALESSTGSVFANALVKELTSPYLFAETDGSSNYYVTLESIVDKVRRSTYMAAKSYGHDQLVVYGSLIPGNEGGLLFFEQDHLLFKHNARKHTSSYDPITGDGENQDSLQVRRPSTN